MAVDLKLLPTNAPGRWLAHDILQLDRTSDLWPHIEDLEQAPIPEPIWCHEARTPDGEPCYGKVEETRYGIGLTWTTVDQLLTLAPRDEIQSSWRNRAVWAYLAQMPADHPIVLFWY